MLFIKIFCIIMIIRLQPILCRVYEECRGINKPDVVVASKKSCAKYIFCAGENSYEGECLAGNYFNEKEGNCDDPVNVKCNIQPGEDVKSIYDEDYTQAPTQEEDVNDNDDDDDGGDDSDDNAEDNEDESSETTEEILDDEKNTSVEVSTTLPKCPQLMGFQNIKNIANPESCVAFFTCYNGMAIAMLCPAKMYFNEESGKCETQMPNSCQSKNLLRLKCHKGVYDYLPYPNRCEYYYYCMNGYLLIMRCPYDFSWHYEQSTCVHKSQSKCYSKHSSFINRNNNN